CVRRVGSAPGRTTLAGSAPAAAAMRGPTWTGNVRRLGSFFDPRLDNARDVWIYLPRSYHTSEQRYPVLYFNDGQNVFDAATSFAGVEWQADETLESATGAGVIREAIAVAVANSQDRIDEYTPATDPRWPGGGRAAVYVRFLV